MNEDGDEGKCWAGQTSIPIIFFSLLRFLNVDITSEKNVLSVFLNVYM